HGAQAAPAGCDAMLAAGAAQGATLTATTLTLVKGTLNVMSWTKVRAVVGVGVLALIAFQQYENSVQARQLSSARQDLHGRIDAVAAQESRIGELEQQTAAISDVRRSQEVELEQLRARRQATGSAARANSTGQPTTLL